MHVKSFFEHTPRLRRAPNALGLILTVQVEQRGAIFATLMFRTSLSALRFLVDWSWPHYRRRVVFIAFRLVPNAVRIEVTTQATCETRARERLRFVGHFLRVLTQNSLGVVLEKFASNSTIIVVFFQTFQREPL